MKLLIRLLFLFSIAVSSNAFACRAYKDIVVFAQDTLAENHCYAISLPPDATTGKKGKTDIHMVENGEDKVVYSFDFYSKHIFLKCGGNDRRDKSVALARENTNFGALEVKDYDLLEFYVDGKLVKKYAASELTTGKDSYWATICGDRIVWKIKSDSTKLVVQFALKRVTYDMMTGEAIKVEDKPDDTYSAIMNPSPAAKAEILPE